MRLFVSMQIPSVEQKRAKVGPEVGAARRAALKSFSGRQHHVLCVSWMRHRSASAFVLHFSRAESSILSLEEFCCWFYCTRVGAFRVCC